MKKAIILVFIALNSMSQRVSAQDFIRVGTGFSFLGSEDFVQSLTFDLNRTEAKKEKGGIYFLFTPDNFYIKPVVDVNIGESVSTSQNNVKFTTRFGKNIFYSSRSTYFFVNVEPTYNTNKEFNEELYYLNLNGGISFYNDKEVRIQLDRTTPIDPVYIIDNPLSGDKKPLLIIDRVDEDGEVTIDTLTTKAYESPRESYPKNFIKREISLTAGSSNNFGGRDSKSFDLSDPYTTIGGFIEFKIQWNSNNLRELIKKSRKSKSFDYQNAQLKKYANWKLVLKGSIYSIVNELEQITTDKAAGIFKVSIDKRITSRIFLSLGYQVGNDQPEYEDINALELGLKLKFDE